MVSLSVRNCNNSERIMHKAKGQPSLWQYYCLVWAKAKQLEKRKWIKHAFYEIVPAIIGIIIMALLGLESFVEHARYELALVGIGLIMIAAWRFVSSLVRAPYQLHLDVHADLAKEQLAKTRANAERDETRRQLSRPPMRPGTLGDVFDRLKAIADEGRGITSPNWDSLNVWHGKAIASLRECLRPRSLETYEATFASYSSKGPFANVVDGPARCLKECIHWLDMRQRGQLTDHDVNPDFMLPIAKPERASC